MSTNFNQLQNSPKEEQTETPKIEIASLNREIQSENRGDSDRGEEEDGTKIDGGEESIEAKVSSRESENCVPEEENDGFRTPTSADHKIPPITECPPAPRKARAQCSLKRRTPPQSSRRRLLFVAAAEAESILTPMSGENAEEQGLKRARTATGDEF